MGVCFGFPKRMTLSQGLEDCSFIQEVITGNAPRGQDQEESRWRETSQANHHCGQLELSALGELWETVRIWFKYPNGEEGSWGVDLPTPQPMLIDSFLRGIHSPIFHLDMHGPSVLPQPDKKPLDRGSDVHRKQLLMWKDWYYGLGTDSIIYPLCRSQHTGSGGGCSMKRPD